MAPYFVREQAIVTIGNEMVIVKLLMLENAIHHYNLDSVVL